jgi:CubicO group peptidase (beta-lactamase class C family)
MRLAVTLLLVMSYSEFAKPVRAADFPGAAWKIAGPVEDFGWSSEKLAVAQQFAEQAGSDAVIVVDDGIVVAEWGDMAKRLNIYSMRKSLLSALIGIAVGKGTIKLDATMEGLGIDDEEPALTPAERRATVRDLLKSRSGVYHRAAYEAITNALARPRRGSHAAGEFFYYNNWDFNTLGTIYEQQTRLDIFTAFQDQIATPLGMQDFRKEDGRYDRHRASRHAAYLFDMSARDLARFGLLYLREGDWKGGQLVPRDWVKASTAVQVKDATPNRSYGYLWWVYPQSGNYEASGKGGQRIFVSPRDRLVVVHLIDVAAPGKRDLSNAQFFELVRLIRDARMPKKDAN